MTKGFKDSIEVQSVSFKIPETSINSVWRRQRDSVVRAGDLNAGDPGSNPRLGLLNEFVLGDPRGKFTMLCK